jgi:MYXO-CTERM domain-containing protein
MTRTPGNGRFALQMMGGLGCIAALALAIAPSMAGAFQPSGSELPVGPPSRHLDYDQAIQARLTSSSIAFDQLVAGEGGQWAVRWDQVTRQPATLWAPGVRWDSSQVLEEAAAFLQRHEALFGVPADSLLLTGDSSSGDRRYVTFSQQVDGVPVEGGTVEFRLRHTDGTDDRLSMVRVEALRLPAIDTTPRVDRERALQQAMGDLVPLRVDVREAGTLVIFAGDPGRAPHPKLAWRSRVFSAEGPLDLVSYVDAHTGALLYRYDDVRHDIEGTLWMEYEERTVDDPLMTVEAAYLSVSGTPGTVAADGLGAYLMATGDDEDLTASMQGPYIVMFDESIGAMPEAVFSALQGTGADFTWTDDYASVAARDVAAHYEIARQYVYEREPGFFWLQEVVPATVNISSGTCNAYYTGGTINFYQEGGGCENFGRVSDVVYHEYGHGVHHYIIESGGFDGTVSEGSADYLSCTIWDDPYMAMGAYGPGTWIREIESDRVYPADIINEVHHDGLIWGSALWDIREEMIATYGYDDGVELTDLLFLNTLKGGPSLTETYDDLIFADDDDGDLTNGTPHLCTLTEIMGNHGLGPGDMGYFLYEHTPLDSQPGTAASYPVEASFEVVEPACSDFDTSSVTLHYAMDPAGPFTDLPMVFDGATGYTEAIPRHPAGATVYYYISAADSDGGTVFTTHGEDSLRLHSFLVGDFQVIYCDDGESGAGDFVHLLGAPDAPEAGDTDWELGLPQGLSGDPDHAYSGGSCWGTNHGNGTDGEYINQTSQFLSLPDRMVGGYERVRLQYRRWLTVEDGFYDHSRLEVNGTVVWENPDHGGGTHWFDTDWVLHDLYVDDLVDENDSLSIAWTLLSDYGLEFGGWNIDDVCLVAPDDLAAWYASDDFDATDGEDRQSTLTWSHPFVEPLWAIAVVRNADRYPEDFDDGLIVALDTAPTWGAAMEVVDTDLEPGRTYHYAVFAADEEWNWRSAVIPGGNADTGTPASEGDDDDSAGDDDDTTGSAGDDDDTVGDDDDVADDDDTGAADDDGEPFDPIESDCACRADGSGAGGSMVALAMLLGLGVLRRR